MEEKATVYVLNSWPVVSVEGVELVQALMGRTYILGILSASG